MPTNTEDGADYNFIPIGEFIGVAPGVCGGRPTFKNTRLEVQVVLDLLENGWTIDRIAAEYHRSGVTSDAVREAVRLAGDALLSRAELVARC